MIVILILIHNIIVPRKSTSQDSSKYSDNINKEDDRFEAEKEECYKKISLFICSLIPEIIERNKKNLNFVI